jgi:hypothetical protein
MGKRTHEQVLQDGHKIVANIAKAIREAGPTGKVTISAMSEQAGLSRRTLKHNLAVLASNITNAQAANPDYALVYDWLSNLQTPPAKRKAYAGLIREIVESAEIYGIGSFTDVAAALSLPHHSAMQWYAKYCGTDRPMLDGNRDPNPAKRLASKFGALGEVEMIEQVRAIEAERIAGLQDILRPRVEEIESRA